MIMYNDNDSGAVAWLREVVASGLLPEGRVDDRSITDLTPEDCAPSSDFFAGLGGWRYALRLAGWPQDLPVWTGSCPCQPFSAAGKRKVEGRVTLLRGYGNAIVAPLAAEFIRAFMEVSGL